MARVIVQWGYIVVDIRIARATRANAIAPPSPSSAGAVARGVGELASAVTDAVRIDAQVDEEAQNQQVQFKRAQQDQEDQQLSLAQSAALAAMSERERVRSTELRLSAGPGGAGFRESLQTERAQWLSEFDAGFGSNERVRQHFMEPVARFDARSDTSAQLETLQAQAVKSGNDWSIMLDTLGNVISGDHSPSRLAEALSQVDTASSALIGLTDEQRAAARRDAYEKLHFAFANGLINNGSDVALGQMIEQGHFDSVLDPQHLENLRSQVTVAGNARELETRRAASEARKSATQQIQLLQSRIEAGEQPSPSEIAAVRAAATAAGNNPADIYELSVMQEDVIVNRTFAGQSAAQLGRTLAEITPKIVAGTATLQEQRLAHRIPAMQRARTSTAAALYHDEYASGEAGELSVAAQLTANVHDEQDRFTQAEAVHAGFGYLLGVNPRYQPRAVAGARVVANNRDLFPPAATAAAYRSAIGGTGNRGALSAMQSDAQAAIGTLATNIYAGIGGRFEHGEPDQPQLYARAVNYALGGEYRDGHMVGGLSQWHGNTFVLPEGLTATQFGERLGRVDFSGARDAENNIVTKANIFRAMHPVFVGIENGESIYYFEAANGARLLNSERAPFRLRVPPR